MFLRQNWELLKTTGTLGGLLNLTEHGAVFDTTRPKTIWSQKERQKLLESIFHDKCIGTILFSQNTDGSSEILDGRERFETIVDFMKDKFKYNGLLFSEMHGSDQRVFKYESVHLTIVKPFSSLSMLATCLSEENKKEFLKHL